MQDSISLPLFSDEVEDAIRKRLARVEGQVRGVSKMLDEQRPCMELLQQLASIQAAIRGTSKVVLRNYLEHCATNAIRSGETDVYDELMDAVYKFAR